MITIEKLKIYQKYHGDGDMWNRLGTYEESQILQFSDWKIIDNLIQDLILMSKVKISDDYGLEIETRLLGNCDNQSTVKYIKEIAINLK